MARTSTTAPKETMFEQVRRIVEQIDKERDEIARVRRKETPRGGHRRFSREIINPPSEFSPHFEIL